MAGGLGTRLNLGEKPLVTLAEKPMLSYVISAFEDAGCSILVVVTPKVPMTKNWCRANGIETYQSDGTGYVEDLIECILETGEQAPFFSCVSDLPGINKDIIDKTIDLHRKSGKEACSVWVPENLFSKNNCKCSYSEEIEDIVACPVGLNILNGANICNEQEELKVLLNEPCLTFNVNTREELKNAENFFRNF
jgi:adenosylcobinamide-phosphate guanylyltransferase